MPRPKKRRAEEAAVSADLMPVLSCMFLLIPALLLAMEVARMVSIPVSPPRFTGEPTGERDPNNDLRASVHIRNDGFAIKTGAGNDEEIPLREGTYDYAALQAWAKKIKAAFPQEWTVTISAENDIEMHTLVAAMDALRGDECHMAGAMHGEAVPPSCLLWRPIVSDTPLG